MIRGRGQSNSAGIPHTKSTRRRELPRKALVTLNTQPHGGVMTDAIAQPQDAELASQAMARRFELDTEIAIIQGRHKGELEPLLEEQKLCETFVKDFMNTSGIQQYKIASGDQAFFQAKDSVTAGDFEATLDYIVAAPALQGFQTVWDTILKHIRAAGNCNLLDNSVNKN